MTLAAAASLRPQNSLAAEAEKRSAVAGLAERAGGQWRVHISIFNHEEQEGHEDLRKLWAAFSVVPRNRDCEDKPENCSAQRHVTVNERADVHGHLQHFQA